MFILNLFNIKFYKKFIFVCVIFIRENRKGVDEVKFIFFYLVDFNCIFLKCIGDI